jgi:RimJ/RimL family protein N-acetyltransferase
VCQKGIEIQIDTKKNYQGRGLATDVAATMIIHCLENNIIPGWDAATQISARLAEKLGYTHQGEYTMLVFTGSRLLVALRNSIHKVRRRSKK